jgi:arylsulfatase A-like enzyme
MSTILRAVRNVAAVLPRHIVLAGSAGLIAGAVEAAVAPAADVPVGLACALGALLGAHLGVFLGIPQAVVVQTIRWLGGRTGLWAWVASRTTRDPNAPREPVVGLHAGVLAALAAGLVGLATLWVAFGMIFKSADTGVAQRFAVVAVAGVAGFAVILGVALQRVVTPAVAWADRRWLLPRPHGAVLRYLVFVALPLGVPLAGLLVVGARALGTYAAPMWLVVLVIAEGLLWLGWRAWRGDRPGPAAGRAGALVGGGVVALAVVTPLLFGSPQAAEAARGGVFAGLSLKVLRGATDVDGDGSSGLYAGGDCAPFDAGVGPRAYDAPGDGVDQNCDGVDAEARGDAIAETRTFLGDLEGTDIKPRKYHVVWVIVDAVRADRCSLYGAKAETTPYLEELAKESLVFTRAYSQSSATMLSIPSMLSGRRPGALDWVKTRRMSLGEGATTIAEHLKSIGYKTGIVADKYMRDNLTGALQGYETIEDTWLDGKGKPWTKRNAAVAMTLASRILEKHRVATKNKTPLFLTVYSSDPHHPYDKHSEGFPKFTGEMAVYDSEIAFADRYTGALVDLLRYTKMWDDTIFIFTSDHGEEFGEHGGETHAYTCYEESTHVPLLIRIPGVKPQRIDTRVALTDVVPALVEALGVGPGDMELDGQSLLIPAFAPQAVAADRPIYCNVLSQKPKQGDFFRQAVRSGERALMHDWVAQKFEYYDLTADPGEATNLVDRGSESETIARLKGILEAELTGNLRELRLTGPNAIQGKDGDE